VTGDLTQQLLDDAAQLIEAAGPAGRRLPTRSLLFVFVGAELFEWHADRDYNVVCHCGDRSIISRASRSFASYGEGIHDGAPLSYINSPGIAILNAPLHKGERLYACAPANASCTVILEQRTGD
jgi:rhodanese-related sulfurtransferase